MQNFMADDMPSPGSKTSKQEEEIFYLVFLNRTFIEKIPGNKGINLMQLALLILILLEYPVVAYAHRIDPFPMFGRPLYLLAILGSFLYNSFIVWAMFPKWKEDWINKLFILATFISFLLIGKWIMTTP